MNRAAIRLAAFTLLILNNGCTISPTVSVGTLPQRHDGGTSPSPSPGLAPSLGGGTLTVDEPAEGLTIVHGAAQTASGSITGAGDGRVVCEVTTPEGQAWPQGSVIADASGCWRIPYRIGDRTLFGNGEYEVVFRTGQATVARRVQRRD